MTQTISCLWVSHSSGVLKLILSRLHNVNILGLMRYCLVQQKKSNSNTIASLVRCGFSLITCLVFIHEDIRQYVNAIVIHKLSNPLDCNINITQYRIKKEIMTILAAWKPSFCNMCFLRRKYVQYNLYRRSRIHFSQTKLSQGCGIR